VFREIARVLKPGGRLAVSDIALKKPLPPEISKDVMAYVGCISGAIQIEDYQRQLIEAGFANVQVIDSGADLNAYAKIENQSGCCSPSVDAQETKAIPAPAGGCCGSSTPAPATESVMTSASCCAPTNLESHEEGLFEYFTELLSRYSVNEYAASVKVFAVK